MHFVCMQSDYFDGELILRPGALTQPRLVKFITFIWLKGQSFPEYDMRYTRLGER